LFNIKKFVYCTIKQPQKFTDMSFTATIQNESITEFEKLLFEFSLEDQIIDIEEGDFRTTFTFSEALSHEHECWINSFIEDLEA